MGVISQLFYACMPTKVYPVAETTCGTDVLKLIYVEESSIGNTQQSLQLFWNNRIVDIQGNSRQYKHLMSKHIGYKGYPIDPDDRRNLRIETVQDSAKNGWVIWVNPKDFSATEFETITQCLRANHDVLVEKWEKVAEENGWAKLTFMPSYPTFPIYWAIYGDYHALSVRTYERKRSPNFRDELTVGVEGWASIRVYEGNDPAARGGTIGQLTPTADTLQLWPDPLNGLVPNLPFGPEDMAGFTNAAGEPFTKRYRVIQKEREKLF
jgi:hypothetical protein